MLHYIERRKEIMDLVLRHGLVKVSELATRYSISEATVRRDLKFLAREYGIQLTYGGAFASERHKYQRTIEVNIDQKRAANLAEKRVIAKKAAELIQEGDTIALNAGSTVELILEYVDESRVHNLSVITLALNVAVRASTMPFVEIYMPGGKLRRFSGAFYGKESEDFLRQLNVNKAFFGAVAVRIDSGVTHPVLEEVSSNRVLFDISKERYLVADSSKFGKVSLVKMADLLEFDAFIVDDHLDKKYSAYADVNGIKLI
jgi:DeoR family transcriptional regulator, aga operon transcriptional repressor